MPQVNQSKKSVVDLGVREREGKRRKKLELRLECKTEKKR